jgi:threonine dehydratase
VLIDPPSTIADGARTRQPGELTFTVVSKLASGVVTVTDDEIRAAVRFLALRAKMVVEPTGALGVAALLTGRLAIPRGSRVGVVISGGNVDPGALGAILGGSG